MEGWVHFRWLITLPCCLIGVLLLLVLNLNQGPESNDFLEEIVSLFLYLLDCLVSLDNLLDQIVVGRVKSFHQVSDQRRRIFIVLWLSLRVIQVARVGHRGT